MKKASLSGAEQIRAHPYKRAWILIIRWMSQYSIEYRPPLPTLCGKELGGVQAGEECSGELRPVSVSGPHDPGLGDSQAVLKRASVLRFPNPVAPALF